MNLENILLLIGFIILFIFGWKTHDNDKRR